MPFKSYTACLSEAARQFPWGVNSGDKSCAFVLLIKMVCCKESPIAYIPYQRCSISTGQLAPKGTIQVPHTTSGTTNHLRYHTPPQVPYTTQVPHTTSGTTTTSCTYPPYDPSWLYSLWLSVHIWKGGGETADFEWWNVWILIIQGEEVGDLIDDGAVAFYPGLNFQGMFSLTRYCTFCPTA